MNIYLAARFSQHPEMQGVRDVLHGLGHHVTSRWIDLHAGMQPNSIMGEQLNEDPAAYEFIGLHDLEDLDAADTVISFTLVGGGKGGRHVEFGYGLATGKRMILVGPREHAFHCLPQVEHYDNRPDLFMAFSKDFWSAA
jgi:hypothetical protein